MGTAIVASAITAAGCGLLATILATLILLINKRWDKVDNVAWVPFAVAAGLSLVVMCSLLGIQNVKRNSTMHVEVATKLHTNLGFNVSQVYGNDNGGWGAQVSRIGNPNCGGTVNVVVDAQGNLTVVQGLPC